MATWYGADTEFDYDRMERNDDGSITFYDANGNVTHRRDAEGRIYQQNYDPETGQAFESEWKGGGSANIGTAGGESRRAQRRNARREEAARLGLQEATYGAKFFEGLGGVTGAFGGMEGELPSELDLLGGTENADSQLAGAEADAGAIAAQRAALAQLSQIAQGGYTAEEAAAMQRMRMETAQQEQSQRQAVQQQMAMRGMSGSGAELAGQLAAQQGGANRMNEQQLETQAQAQRRALQALGMQGDLSSGMRGQSFDEESTRRGAADDFTRWNLDRRGGAAQQRYANRFGLAQAQSDASGRSAELAGGRRSEVQEQQNRNDDKRTDRTSKILGSIF